MLKVIRNTALQLFLTVLLTSCASLPGAVETVGEGEVYFTKVNMWHTGEGEIPSTNYHTGKKLPAGTRVKIVKTGWFKITFETSSGDVLTLTKKLRHCKISMEDLFERHFSKENVMSEGGPYSGFSPAEQDNIEKGTITPGMSKDAVVMAYGYPPSHRTPALSSDIWYYWVGRRRVTAYFKNDVLSNISGVEAIRPIKIYAVSDPPGAAIELNGKFKCKAPCIMEIRLGAVDMSRTMVFRATPSAPTNPRLGVMCDAVFASESLAGDPISVREVIPLSMGHRLGLVPGDKILAVNNLPVKDESDCMQALRSAGFDSPITIKVKRGTREVLLKGKTDALEKGRFRVTEKKVTGSELVAMDGKVMLFGLRGSAAETQKLLKKSDPPRPQEEAVKLPMVGTGFVVSGEGHVLTCASIVRNAGKIILLSSDGKQHRASILLKDDINDWSLLKADSLRGEAIPIAPETSVQAGAKTYLIGYSIDDSENRLLQTGSGRIVKAYGFGGDKRHIEARLSGKIKNVSGSPLLDEHGRWIGLVSDKLDNIINTFAGRSGSERKSRFLLKSSVISKGLPSTVQLAETETTKSKGTIDEGSVRARLSFAIVAVYAE